MVPCLQAKWCSSATTQAGDLGACLRSNSDFHSLMPGHDGSQRHNSDPSRSAHMLRMRARLFAVAEPFPRLLRFLRLSGAGHSGAGRPSVPAACAGIGDRGSSGGFSWERCCVSRPNMVHRQERSCVPYIDRFRAILLAHWRHWSRADTWKVSTEVAFSSWCHMAHTVSCSLWLIAPFWQRQGGLRQCSATPSSSCGPLMRVSQYPMILTTILGTCRLSLSVPVVRAVGSPVTKKQDGK